MDDKRIAEAERRYWLQVKARGRSRFIWRNKVLGSVFVWFLVSLGLGLFVDRHQYSARNVVIYLIMLPIWMLAGYLNGKWKWEDLEKKYPE